MRDTKTTNLLLLIIVIPLVFYLLKTLSFIFIPLVLSMFIALLFLPLMRWLKKRSVPKPLSILIVIIIITGVLKLGGELIQLTSNEIIATKDQFLGNAETKIVNLIIYVEDFFGVERLEGETIFKRYSQEQNILARFGSTLDFITNTISMTLMTAFFVILLLSESINFQNILNNTIFKQKYSSVKTFMTIEKDIIRFVKVKFVISLLTGIGFSIACLIFGVSFPIFWGLLAFTLNFIQMIGSVVSVLLLALFAFVELDPTGTLLFFIIVITGVQVLFGGILEPLLMGKTFSLNVITILIMLMFWGFIWGIPGLIMSIPITVFIKIVLEQFPKTKVIADLMSAPESMWKVRQKIIN
ncbi:MAG: AI-2E family transporter [Draconibacterium sp.]|nr:AI-2E family transporter [Draconibacterium sp.]